MSRENAWGNYWATGRLTTFGDKPTYQGSLRELWQEFFSMLPDGATIADLGAGNGALAEIARECCATRGARLHMHALDAAKISPGVSSDPSRGFTVEWHPSTHNETTGLPGGSVDAVTGNFAFEYGDESLTAKEIARILKPGGKCRFLMHHSQSVVILDSRGELAVLDTVLGRGGLFDEVRECLRDLGKIRKPSQFEKFRTTPAAARRLARINDCRNKAAAIAETPNAVALLSRLTADLNRLISPPMIFEPKPRLLEHLTGMKRAYSANRGRLADMQKAAVDEKRAESICEVFRSHDLRATAEPYFIPTHANVIGWKVDVSQ